MATETLKVTGVTMRPPLAPTKAAEQAQPASTPHMNVAIEVTNSSDKAQQVWSTRRAYDYDADSRVLTLYMTEHTPPPPPGIKMISNHPRTPRLVTVPPKGRATLEIPVPGVIRKRTPGKGLGMSFVEVPITSVDRVELHLQYGPPLRAAEKDEGPDKHRARLLSHGDVLHSTHPLDGGGGMGGKKGK